MEEMALNYFRGLNKSEKKQLMRKIIDSLSEEERVELAKLLLKKWKKCLLGLIYKSFWFNFS